MVSACRQVISRAIIDVIISQQVLVKSTVNKDRSRDVCTRYTCVYLMCVHAVYGSWASKVALFHKRIVY